MSWFRRTPIAAASWIAIDCETSGLDMRRDRLLSVGAVPVRDGRIQLAGSYTALLRQEAPSAADNILVHGIGGDAQLSGLPREAVMEELARRVGDAIPVGFHAPFDEAVLRRHGFTADKRWLDLATLAPALFAQHRALTSLEQWLDAFGIAVEGRHDAVGDAFSTAQLFLVVLDEAKRQGLKSVEDLRAVERGRRWL